MTKVRIYRIRRNPIRPMPVMGFRLLERSFLRIQVEDDSGQRYVDCSPLPHLHSESLEDCLSAAKSYFRGEDKDALLPVSLESALGYLGEREDGPIEGAWENTALLTLSDIAPLQARVCKFKVGPDELGGVEAFMSRMLDQRKDRRFRLDFNRGITSSDFPLLAQWLNIWPIEYFEEPSASIEELKVFAREFPLALDEHLGADAELDRLAKAWVIKPNVLGYRRTKQLLMSPVPIKKVLSNSFESSETLQLYASVYGRWCKRPEALGFGTAFYFQDKGLEWDPAAYGGAWPNRMFSNAAFEGDVLWQN